MRTSLALAFAFAAVAGACSVPKAGHCANQSVPGDAYCKALDIDTPHCSSCAADNNGCVAAPIAEVDCEVGSTSVGSTSTASPTTSDGSSTTGGSTTTTGDEPSTTSSTSTGAVDPTTGDPSTTTGGPATTTGTTDTGTTDTGSSDDTTTTDATDFTTDTTDATTMDGPMCGDDVQDDPEICDGADLNGFNCPLKNPLKYGGGLLKCNGECSAYDETGCCLTLNQSCQPAVGQKCCPGLKCTLLLGLGKCKPA
jgi:hypothetical protein